MKTRPLGTSGIELSVIGYGAWEASSHWGADFDDQQIIAAIHAGADAGINWVDTAEGYGPHTTQEIDGRALKGRDVMVATKVAPRPGGTGHRPDDVKAACKASLQRLGRDVIDLYQLHWPDENTPVEDTWAAMAELQDAGLVRAIGLSNYNQTQIERCNKIRHVDSLQPHFSLLHRDNEPLISWCGESGIGTVVYGPLAYGLLTGTITMETTFAPDDWRSGSRGFGLYERFFAPGAREKHLQAIAELRTIGERVGVRLADLAIAWILTQPGVTSAIVGSRNPSHVRDNVVAAEIELDPTTLAEIEVSFKR
jgi:methylglyoxal reductase